MIFLAEYTIEAELKAIKDELSHANELVESLENDIEVLAEDLSIIEADLCDGH